MGAHNAASRERAEYNTVRDALVIVGKTKVSYRDALLQVKRDKQGPPATSPLVQPPAASPPVQPPATRQPAQQTRSAPVPKPSSAFHDKAPKTKDAEIQTETKHAEVQACKTAEVEMEVDGKQLGRTLQAAQPTTRRVTVDLQDICKFFTHMIKTINEGKNQQEVAETMVGAAKKFFGIKDEDIKKISSGTTPAAQPVN